MPTETLPSYHIAHSPMQPIFVARLPVPPSVNNMYKIVYYGNTRRLALTEAANKFKEDAADALTHHTVYNYRVVNEVRDAAEESKAGAMPHLELSIDFYFREMWKRDEDGAIKIVQDSLFEYLDINDRFVVRVIATKHQSSDPRTEVQLRCLVPVVSQAE